MNDLESLFILAALVWSVLGGVLGKKGKRGAQAPRRPDRPGGHAPEPRPAPPSTASRAPAQGDAAGDPAPARARGSDDADRPAAEMIPDDLWEILTGERRAPAPERSPAPASHERASWESATWESTSAEPGPEWSDVEARPSHGEEAASLEQIPAEELPVVVSVETPPPPPEERHRAFHEKLASASPVRRPARRRALAMALGGRSELRRAMVLREVLGPPKGLE
ncbi:MAG TPA: hypothetical protein VF158_00565 [Longimicrobiales bacterium]